jgi:hypothetical protein
VLPLLYSDGDVHDQREQRMRTLASPLVLIIIPTSSPEALTGSASELRAAYQQSAAHFDGRANRCAGRAYRLEILALFQH